MTRTSGISWPYQEHARIAQVNGQIWSIQRWGTGPRVLFLHGTGASAHSWAPLLSVLNGAVDALSVDLLGHRLTPRPRRGHSSLSHMTQGLAAVCSAQEFTPDLIVGHSAGAVIAVDLAEQLNTRSVLSINGAFGAFPGPFHSLFSTAAQVMAATRLSAIVLSGLAQNRARVERLLKNTGSNVPQAQLNYYHALFKDPEHVGGVLQFMADWNIKPFLKRLPHVARPVHFLSSAGDKTIPPSLSASWYNKLANGTRTSVPRHGHLVHEEAPSEIAAIIHQMVP